MEKVQKNKSDQSLRLVLFANIIMFTYSLSLTLFIYLP